MIILNDFTINYNIIFQDSGTKNLMNIVDFHDLVIHMHGVQNCKFYVVTLLLINAQFNKFLKLHRFNEIHKYPKYKPKTN